MSTTDPGDWLGELEHDHQLCGLCDECRDEHRHEDFGPPAGLVWCCCCRSFVPDGD